MDGSHATKHDIFSLVGKLSWATKCIPAGRIFVRRMLDLVRTMKHLHYKFRLNQEFIADLNWWRRFLPVLNGKYSFPEPHWTASESLEPRVLGVAVFLVVPGSKWPELVLGGRCSIAWLEIVPVLIACLVWGHCWLGKRTTIHSDNQSVGLAWAKLTSSHKGIMDLIRKILFLGCARELQRPHILCARRSRRGLLMHCQEFRIFVPGNLPRTPIYTEFICRRRSTKSGSPSQLRRRHCWT